MGKILDISSKKFKLIKEFINENMAVSRKQLKNKFKLSDKKLEIIMLKLGKSNKISIMRNKIVWTYCPPKLQQCLLQKVK